MSDTPRTDAIALRPLTNIANLEMIGDLAELARQLERENLRLREALEHIERITFKESVGDIAREALHEAQQGPSPAVAAPAVMQAADTHYRCWTCNRIDPKECDRADCPG